MDLLFPNLSKSPAQRIVACGCVEPGSKKLEKWLVKPRVVFSSYKKGNVEHCVRAMTGGKKHHFHIEIVRRDWFPEDFELEDAVPLEEIQKLYIQVAKRPILLTYETEFLIPFTDLPEHGPIRLLSANTSAGGTSVELVAGTFNVSGSKVSSVKWKRIGEKNVRISLRSTLKTDITPEYVIEGHELSDRFFRILLLEEPRTP